MKDSRSTLGMLMSRLRTVMQYQSLRFRLIAFCTLVILIGGLFLLFSVSDIAFKFPTEIQWTLWCISVASLTTALFLFITRGLKERAEARRIAASIEQKFPAMETNLSTSIEFGNDPQKTGALSSQAIVDALVADTAERSQTLNFLKAIDWTKVKRLAAILVLAVMLCLLYATWQPRLFKLTFLRFVAPWSNTPPPTLTVVDIKPKGGDAKKLSDVKIIATVTGRLPKDSTISYAYIPDDAKDGTAKLEWRKEKMRKIEADLPAQQPQKRPAKTSKKEDIYEFTFPRILQSVKYYVSAGDYTTKRYLLNVYEIPKITNIVISLKRPEYTGIEREIIKNALGPITALKGTEVEITATVNKKIASAKVEFDGYNSFPGEIIEPEKDKFKVKFVIMNSCKYKLLATDFRNRTNDAISYPITALDDQPPTVKIKEPGRDIKVTKTTEVPLEIEATDDFGISEVGIAYKVKTEDETRVTLEEFTKRLTKIRKDDTLYLEDMKLADTDIVSYYAYAKDNNIVDGPKEGLSKLYFIEIRPFGERYREKEEKGGGHQPQSEEEKSFAEKLEDLAKRQREILAKTFDLNKESGGDIDLENTKQVTRTKDLASEEEDVRRATDRLARNLTENLMAFGLGEHIDRLENLEKAGNQMALAWSALEFLLDPKQGMEYENSGLYHLYRAKRDIIHMLKNATPEERKRMEQALQTAVQGAQSAEQRERDRQMAQLEQQKQQLHDMKQQQQQLNQQMQQMASAARQQQAQAQQQASQSGQQQQTPNPNKVAQEQNKLSKRAKNETQQLRNMDYKNPNQSYAAADEMNRATGEMMEAADRLQKNRPQDALDHGKKAEERIANALRELDRAMEDSATDQLRQAANRARRLAEKQHEIGNETERLEQGLPPIREMASARRFDQQQSAQQQQTGKPQQGQQQGNQQQQAGQPQQGKQQTGKPQQGQQQGNQQQQAGQPQQGKQQTGKLQQGQQQGNQQQQAGQPQQGKQQGQSSQRQMVQAGSDQQQQREQSTTGAQQQGQHRPQSQQNQAGESPQQANAAQRQNENQQGRGRQPQLAQRNQRGGTQSHRQQAASGSRENRRQTPAERRNELAQAQQNLRNELDDFINDLEQIAQQVASVDREIGEKVQDVTRKMQSGEIQRGMRDSERNLEQNSLPQARRAQRIAEDELKGSAQKLADLADQFTMDDNQRLSKAIEKAKNALEKQQKVNEGASKLARQLEAEKQRPINRQDMKKLEQEQAKVQKETQDLAQQTGRIKSLEQTGANVPRSLERAAQDMEQSKQQLAQAKPQESIKSGNDAARQLRQSIKAMKQLLSESLNRQLADAVEMAKDARDAQNDARETLDKAVKETPQGKRIPPEKYQQARDDQGRAQEKAAELAKKLPNLVEQARSAGEQPLAKSLRRTSDELKQSRAQQQMAQAQRNMQQGNYPSAQQNQRAASQSLGNAYASLNDIYEDQVAMPFQRLKRVEEKTRQLAKKIDELKGKVEKANAEQTKNKGEQKNNQQPNKGKAQANRKAAPGQKQGGNQKQKQNREQDQLDALAKESSALKRQTDNLADRLARLSPSKEEKKSMKEVQRKMAESAQRLGNKQTENVTPGLSQASKLLQTIGDGLIERINRLADESKRKEPEEENVPEKYRELVRQYFKGLSDRTVSDKGKAD